MNARPCDVLDDYLLGDLAEREEATFRSHLDACDDCRRELAFQSQLDALLVSERARAAPDALRTLVVASATQVSRRRTTRRLVAATTAVGAAIMISIWPGLWAPGSADNQPLTVSAVDAPPEQVAAAETSVSQPAAQFESDDMIALPVPSNSPEITIVRLYPTTEALRRQRVEAALYEFLESNGG